MLQLPHPSMTPVAMAPHCLCTRSPPPGNLPAPPDHRHRYTLQRVSGQPSPPCTRRLPELAPHTANYSTRLPKRPMNRWQQARHSLITRRRLCQYICRAFMDHSIFPVSKTSRRGVLCLKHSIATRIGDTTHSTPSGHHFRNHAGPLPSDIFAKIHAPNPHGPKVV